MSPAWNRSADPKCWQAGILYERDARGRVAIERKEDARKRGVKPGPSRGGDEPRR